MKNINIGLTINIKSDNITWNNGIVQNTINLAMLLKNSDNEYNTFLVNTSDIVDVNIDYNIDNILIYPISEIINNIDLLIIIGSQISEQHYNILRNNNKKIVYYNCGASYIIDMQQVLFKPDTTKKFYKQIPDEVWIIPQNYKINKYYFETLYKVECKEVPFIWSSSFIDFNSKVNNLDFSYKPSNSPKRISCFEPNLDVVKYVMYDILIVEQLYREHPELIEHMYITNSQNIKNNSLFIDIMKMLDIVKNGVASFEHRYKTPYFLNTYTDIVISHQWENPLNYAYLDALYLNYPLVHNAFYIKDAGYYYDGFNVKEGKNQLLYAMTEHDKNLDEYNYKSKLILDKYLPNNKLSILKYDKLINDLYKNDINVSNLKKDDFFIKDGISIVMAYHNRKELLLRTLKSIRNSKFDKSKLQIIIVDDCSSQEHKLDDIKTLFFEFDIDIINIKNDKKKWLNSCVTYNIGFNYIKYNKVIIQNPECYHNGDILEYTYNNLTDNNYLSFACYSLTWENTELDNYDNIILNNIKSKGSIYDGWYNHSIYNPLYYHFCNSITYKKLCDLNGFDENYKDGIGFDDNELVERIKKLKLDMIIIDNPFVYHQAHDSIYRYNKYSNKIDIDKKNELFNLNRKIFEEITKKQLFYKNKNNKYFCKD